MSQLVNLKELFTKYQEESLSSDVLSLVANEVTQKIFDRLEKSDDDAESELIEAIIEFHLPLHGRVDSGYSGVADHLNDVVAESMGDFCDAYVKDGGSNEDILEYIHDVVED